MFDPGGPLVVPSVASIAALVGLIVVAWSLGRRGPERLSAIPFALLPPVFFVSIELVEAVVDRESLLTHGLLSPTFALGLVAQGPVAVICLAVARLLIRFGQAVQRVVGALGSSATLWAELRVWRASSELVVRAGTVFERRTRGPPSLA